MSDLSKLRVCIGTWFIPPGELFCPPPFIFQTPVKVHAVAFEATPPSVLGIASISFGGLPVLYSPTLLKTLNTLQIKGLVTDSEGRSYQDRIGYGLQLDPPRNCDRGVNVAVHLKNLGANVLRVSATLTCENWT